MVFLMLIASFKTFADSKYLLHIADKDEWKEAKISGEYVHESISEEGFIHCSSERQVIPIANQFFKGNKNLVLLEVNPKKLKSKLKLDYVEKLDQYFPHIYGPINIDAVSRVFKFLPNKQGFFQLPKDL